MDWTGIGYDALKVMGGIGTTAIGYFTVRGIRPPKQNGHTGNTELLKMMHTTMQNGFLDASGERDTLFKRVNKISEDVTTMREKVARLEVKAETPKKNHAHMKPQRQFQCLVIDDQADGAESTSRLLESYLKGIITCTPVSTVEAAKEMLGEQEYDLSLIDYYLTSTENGYDVWKYFKKAHPKMKCLIYSGKSPDSISPEIKDIYMEKPFKRDVVVKKIQQLLN